MGLEDEFPDRHQSIRDVLRFFSNAHLPDPLRGLSRQFANLAREVVTVLPDDPELTWGLRQLLLAKDAVVRLAAIRLYDGTQPATGDAPGPAVAPPIGGRYELDLDPDGNLAGVSVVHPVPRVWQRGVVPQPRTFATGGLIEPGQAQTWGEAPPGGPVAGFSDEPELGARPAPEAPAPPPGEPSETPEEAPRAETTWVPGEPGEPFTRE